MDPPKCCSQIQNISKLAQECCTSSNSLKDIAEKRWISLLAYFCAFMPWGIIYAFDFIGDRWKTIRVTRRDGILHIVFTLLPLFYVLFYAYLQWVTENHQELSAALTAAVLSIVHVLRTIWGLVQLSIFEDWTFRALQCLSNMGCWIPMHRDIEIDDGELDDGELDDGDFEVQVHSNEIDFDVDTSDSFVSQNEHYTPYTIQRIQRKFCSDKSLKLIVQHCMPVNNTIIDNVFHGAELPVRFRKPIRFGSRIETHQSSWGGFFSNFMVCTVPAECIIRWSVAFLSQFGAPWLVEFKAGDDSPHIVRKKQSERCISLQKIAVSAFLQVTKIDREHHLRSLFDPGLAHDWTSSTLHPRNISKSCFPYQHAPSGIFALSRFKHTITDAKNSWDARALNSLSSEEHSAVAEISGSQISSFFYILDKQPKTSQNFLVTSKRTNAPLSAYRIEQSLKKQSLKEQWAREAEWSLMEQLTLKGCMQFSELMKAAPVPNASICAPLWENSVQGENRLILQASVHIDNWLSLDTGSQIIELNRSEVVRLVETADDEFVFEMQKNFELERLSELIYRHEAMFGDKAFSHSPRFLGCIMETVRKFTTEWVQRNEKHEDWQPYLTQPVDFSISCQLEQSLRTPGRLNRSTWMRLLWEAQSGMEHSINRSISDPPRTLHKSAFLCILGFPSITVWEELSGGYIIRPLAAPQDIRLLLTVRGERSESSETGSVTIRMQATDARGNSPSIPFHWDRWRDAFLGRLYAQSEWLNRMGLAKLERGLHSASKKPLCEALQEYVASWGDSETNRSQKLPVWDGWPPHNTRIEFSEVVAKEALSCEIQAAESGHSWIEKCRSIIEMHEPAHELADTMDAVEDVFSGESQAPQSDHSWIEKCRSIIEMHEAAVAEIGKNNFEKALQGLSFCVKEFAHSPSLEKMFQTVFRNNTLDREEVDLLVDSMNRGAILLVSQSNVDMHRSYKAMAIEDLGYIFGQVYSKTKSDRALEYSMAGVPMDSPYVEVLKASLNRGIARAHPFLAICFQRRAEREERLNSFSDAKAHNQQVVDHISHWGLDAESPEACLSIGFLLEKGFFSGRDTHKLCPLLQSYQNEPMAQALILEHFRFTASLSSILYQRDQQPRRRYFKRELENIISKRYRVQPDKEAAINVYRHSILAESAKTKSLSFNRQGLIWLGDDLAESLGLFRNAESWAEIASDCLSKYIAVNNLGAVYQMQSDFSSATKQFEKAINASQELQGRKSWETCADGRARHAKTFSPAATAVNNLALLKEIVSEEPDEEPDPSVRAEVVRLYEAAVEQGHPVAMYNYAICLLCGSDIDYNKIHRLLKRVLAVGNELIPMYNFILQALVLEDSVFHITRNGTISWTLSFEEMDGCLVCFKSIEYEKIYGSRYLEYHDLNAFESV